jgi:hypothetical protein
MNYVALHDLPVRAFRRAPTLCVRLVTQSLPEQDAQALIASWDIASSVTDDTVFQNRDRVLIATRDSYLLIDVEILGIDSTVATVETSKGKKKKKKAYYEIERSGSIEWWEGKPSASDIKELGITRIEKRWEK